MGSKASPAVIGAFVVGAVALAVVGVLVFGSGRLFSHTTRAVCFFSGDVSGLKVGAPVKFKGVDIGQVADIRLRLRDDPRALSSEKVAAGIRIPVVVEIDNERLTAQGAQPLLDRHRLKGLIDLGLRAQLVSQSMVTGLLQIQLDFHPGTPATYELGPDSEMTEIPTIPTSLQQIQSAAQDIIRKLEDMHFERLVETATAALDGINKTVQSPGLQETVQKLPETLASINQAVTSLRELTVRIDREQGPLLRSLRETSEKTGTTVEQARATLAIMQATIAPNSPLAVDLTASLREVTQAARSVRLLADLLERDPSVLVRGRGTEPSRREAQAK